MNDTPQPAESVPPDVHGLVNRYQDDPTYRAVVDVLSAAAPTTAEALLAAFLLDSGWSLVRGGDAGLEPGLYVADTSADGYYLTPLFDGQEGEHHA